MNAKSIAKKAFKANAITEEEYKQLLCVIKSSYESLRQKGVWINASTVERPTGHWIEFKGGYYKCDKCGEVERAIKNFVQGVERI